MPRKRKRVTYLAPVWNLQSLWLGRIRQAVIERDKSAEKHLRNAYEVHFGFGSLDQYHDYLTGGN